MQVLLETHFEPIKPFVRYRRSVMELSTKLVSDPLEPSVKTEGDDLWRDEVQPTLASLRKGLSATRLAKDAALKLAIDAKALASGAAGVSVLFGVGSVS